MLVKPEQAYFAIADISGYTTYLTGVELDHAQDIIADIMGVVVKSLRPPFRLAKLEGDAAFFHGAVDKVDGAALRDRIESTYFAFRRRLRDIRMASSCACSACREMQHLDLKFICHHGEFIRQKMAGREELAGRDVILAHRLLKNTAGERLGGNAYAIYSDACVGAAGIDPLAQGLAEHRESVDKFGDVACWLSDLEAAWVRDNERRRHEVARGEAVAVLEFEIAAPRASVWDYFTSPEKRPQWRGADAVRETVAVGRRGVGTINHCMHGEHTIVEEIMDWRPHDYLTLTTLLPMPEAPKILMTYAFGEPASGRTHVEIRIAKPKPKDAAFLAAAGAQFQKTMTAEIAALRALLAGESEAMASADEASPPVSSSRFLTEPVRGT